LAGGGRGGWGNTERGSSASAGGGDGGGDVDVGGRDEGSSGGGGGGGGDSVAVVADAWAGVLEGRMLVGVATSAEGEAFRLRRLDMAKMLAGLGISAVYVQARAA